MLILIYLILGCYGVTSIIVQSKLFKPFRAWVEGKSTFFGKLVSCMLCSGFWVGLLMVILFNMSPAYSFLGEYSLLPEIATRFVCAIFDGAFIASMIYHINLIELYIESKLPDEQ
jgi:hypothetical protein